MRKGNDGSGVVSRGLDVRCVHPRVNYHVGVLPGGGDERGAGCQDKVCTVWHPRHRRGNTQQELGVVAVQRVRPRPGRHKEMHARLRRARSHQPLCGRTHKRFPCRKRPADSVASSVGLCHSGGRIDDEHVHVVHAGCYRSRAQHVPVLRPKHPSGWTQGGGCPLICTAPCASHGCTFTGKCIVVITPVRRSGFTSARGT